MAWAFVLWDPCYTLRWLREGSHLIGASLFTFSTENWPKEVARDQEVRLRLFPSLSINCVGIYRPGQ